MLITRDPRFKRDFFPGDLMFCRRPGSGISWNIAAWSNPERAYNGEAVATHVGIVDVDGGIMEAISGGVSSTPWNKLINDKEKFLVWFRRWEALGDPETINDACYKLLHFAREQIGIDYDYMGVLRFMAYSTQSQMLEQADLQKPNKSYDNNAWYCSELATEAIKATGQCPPELARISSTWVTPDYLDNLKIWR